MKKIALGICFLMCVGGYTSSVLAKGPLRVKKVPSIKSTTGQGVPKIITQRPDPNKLAVTQGKFFKLGDPQLGTKFYGHSIALLQKRDNSFVLAYEAITDSNQGGRTQGLFVHLTPTLQQRGAVITFNQKFKTTVLRSITLKEFSNRNILLVYREKSDQNNRQSAIYYILFNKQGKPITPHVLVSRLTTNLHLVGVTLLPAGQATMITYKKGDQAYIKFINAKGREIMPDKTLANVSTPNAKNRICRKPIVDSVPQYLGKDRLLVAMNCDSISGFMDIDLYGQWIGQFRKFHMKGGKRLERKILNVLPLPGTERFLLHLEDRTMVVMNKPRKSSSVHQFGNELKLLGENHQIFEWSNNHILICYNKKVSSGNYSVHALATDNIGFVKNADQVIMSNIFQPVHMAQLNTKDLLIVGATRQSSMFQYVLIKK